MAPSATTTDTNWSVEYDTLRRFKLFRDPPKDKSAYPRLHEAIRPNVDSFNALFGEQQLLAEAIKDIGTRAFLGPQETATQRQRRRGSDSSPLIPDRLEVRILDIFLDKPELAQNNKFSSKREIYPVECRERNASYRGKLRSTVEYRVNDGEWHQFIKEFGNLPIMLRSNRCHLEKLSPAELVQHKEETEELGGYFIVNGNEKLSRMLIMAKRNYPMALTRSTFLNKGQLYTKHGIQIRCCRPDQTSQTNFIHYLKDGNIVLRWSWKKQEYLIPVMMLLKALVETNDRTIFEKLVGLDGSEGIKNTFVTDRVELLMRLYKAYRLHGKAKTRAYIGQRFKSVLDLPADTPNVEAGTEFLRKIVLVHLGNQDVTESQDQDKFDLLLFMIRKLYALVAGDCTPDNPDAASCQEILLPGFLYGMIIKERLQEWLNSIDGAIRLWSTRVNEYRPLSHRDFHRDFSSKILKRSADGIGQSLEYFLATGNLASSSGLDLQQVSGFTIVAEKINFYRFLSHFRCVHRGAFFQEMRTTTVRKLLPESWGFLCPVHTPDGTPCGLLNHLAHACQVLTKGADVSKMQQVLLGLGLKAAPSASTAESISVQLDGRIIGFCTPKEARMIADTLRYWKVNGENGVPLELEIGFVPLSNGGLYPGLFLSSGPARMIRPVKYLPTEGKDMIGPFEQQFLSIACKEQEIEAGESTHVEIDIRNILSIFANQTPFSDHNQSPRNMYQCQMAKQTMGTPGAALQYRADNKMYRLQTGQTPIARPALYNEYGLDNFPNGTNAIVAVISYTGYDMDDAMILNKSAHERGFGYGTMYKTKIVRLDENAGRSHMKAAVTAMFGFAPHSRVPETATLHLDEKGMPHIGTLLTEGSPLCASHSVTWDAVTGDFVNRDERTQIHTYRDSEPAFVEEVRILGTETGEGPCQTISIKLRITRSPVIGDKFSSRHGQKGVCSQKWPTADMPFSESGIVPDVIINPHAFPSRMTIGMFVESLAGKAGALHGLAQDASPWRFGEEHTAGAHFGEQLRMAGFNHHGNEPMYSGVTGEEFAADIYMGVVFYQRLRHMVNDKFQVRTTGPVNRTTGQPIKGRARGGGIRVGEMERDALLAHGAAFLLQDRLLNCSDYSRAWLCRACGSFLATQPPVALKAGRRRPAGSRVSAAAAAAAGPHRCRRCASAAPYDAPRADVWEDAAGTRFTGGDDTALVAIPGVLRYLDAELAAMGVRLRFEVGP